MKKDLNLLPRSNKKQLTAKSILFMVLVIVFLCMAGYYAITWPIQENERVKANELNLQTELDQYGDFNMRYEELMMKQENATFEIAALAESLDMSKNVFEIIKKLDKSRPNGIEISSIVYSKIGISISGTADKMGTLSEFVVNLRKTDLFSHSNISEVVEGDEGEEGEEREDYSFNLALTYKVEEPEIEEVEEVEEVEENTDEN